MKSLMIFLQDLTRPSDSNRQADSIISFEDLSDQVRFLILRSVTSYE